MLREQLMMFSTKTKVIFISLISAMALSSGIYACSLDGWTDDDGAVAVGQPFGSNLVAGEVDGVSRFEEFCALQATGTGYVESDAPSHTRVRARAYFYPETFSGSNDSNVFVAYDGSSTELFSIAWNNGEWAFDVVGGGSTTIAATGGWDLIEFDWDPSGSGNMDIWVNADSTASRGGGTATIGAGPVATLETVRVGLPDGLNGNSGTLYVDSVEMHNETAIGPIVNCNADADPNDLFNVLDLLAAIDEINIVSLAPGTPDCDASGGAINVLDLLAVIDLINS